MSKEKPAVQFDRVSSADQRDGFSLDAQRSMGEKYAKECGLKVVRAWSVGESASKEVDRKHFFEMIKYVKANGVKDIIFDKIDRACRGFQSAVIIEELIQSHNVRFHFTRDRLIVDANSQPQENMRFYLGTMLGKYYIDNLKAEINKGLTQRREAGLWNSKAPFGYKNIRVGDAKKAVVVPDPESSALVGELFELYSTGNYGHEHLAGLVRRRFPERTISKRIVEEMLTNPFYYGGMKYKGAVINGSHEAIIDKKLWDACQRIKGLRSENYRDMHNNQSPKPFMAMLTCGECGHAVTGETKKKASGKTYIYYHCANSKCQQKSKVTNQESIHTQLQAAFEPFAKFTPKATEAFIEALQGRLEDLDLYTQKMTGELASKRMSIKESIAKLDKMKKEEVLTESEYAEVMLAKETSLREVKVEIDAYNEADLRTFKHGVLVIELLTRIRDFMHKDGFLLEKARLSKLVLSNPKLKDGTIEYSYQKPFDVFLNLTKDKVWWRCRVLTRNFSYPCKT